jgi:hypothetical protein
MSPVRALHSAAGYGAVSRLRWATPLARLPTITLGDDVIISALETGDAYAADLVTLGIPGSDAMLAAADRPIAVCVLTGQSGNARITDGHDRLP